MVFFTEGLARSYGGGVGMSTAGFPSPLQSVAGGGGSINISVNFATPKNISRLCGMDRATCLEDRVTNRKIHV